MTALQHIAFTCRDRVAMERFYTKHFGFRRARVFNAGQPSEFVMLRQGPVCLELFQAGERAVGESAKPSSAIGFRHLCFEVPAIEPVIEALKRESIEVGPIDDSSDISPGLRCAFFADPEGNEVEILENWRDEDNPPPLEPHA
jgi:glyoxylase I family protein